MIGKFYKNEGYKDDHANILIPLTCSKLSDNKYLQKNPQDVQEKKLQKALKIRNTALRLGFTYISKEE